MKYSLCSSVSQLMVPDATLTMKKRQDVVCNRHEYPAGQSLIMNINTCFRHKHLIVIIQCDFFCPHYECRCTTLQPVKHTSNKLLEANVKLCKKFNNGDYK